MEKKKQGRPAKVTLDEKKIILHRYSISAGATSLISLRSHGVFKRLTDFAHELGYNTLQVYDFSNDKEFREYLNQYITAESNRKNDKNRDVGYAYVPFDINKFFFKTKQEQHELLTQRENYFSNLYDTAVKSIEEFKNISEKFSAMRDERKDLMEKVKEQEKQITELKEENVTYKCKINELVRDNRYYRTRVKNSLQDVSSKRNEKKITKDTSFSSLISNDQKIRKEKNTDDDDEIMNLLQEIKDRL